MSARSYAAPNFFDHGSPYLNHPLLTDERTSLEIDFLLSQLKLATSASILDIGCGFGRHSCELLRRGFCVRGIDSSEAMVNAAAQRARLFNLPDVFQVIDAEKYESSSCFEAAICLFTTLGQVNNSADNRSLIMNIGRYLKPDGQIVIEVPQRDSFVSQLKENDLFEGENSYTKVVRNYDAHTHTVREHFEIGIDDKVSHYLLAYYLFSQVELEDLLDGAGFSHLRWYANYCGEPLQSQSPMMLVFGQR